MSLKSPWSGSDSHLELGCMLTVTALAQGFAERVALRYRQAAFRVSDAAPASLALGAAGIAYFLMRYSQFTSDATALAFAAEWAEHADNLSGWPVGLAVPDGDQQEPRHGLYYDRPGIPWVRALVATAGDDGGQATRSALEFVLAAEDGARPPWDVNWGAAGLLLGCAQLLGAAEEPARQRIRAAGDHLAAALTRLVTHEADASLEHLGAAHGWAGIAQALLRWGAALSEAPSPRLMLLLDRLISLRRRTGHWPVRPGSRVVYRGWCHGSAGWAQLWALAWQRTGDERMLLMAEECAAHALADPAPGTSLCCGRAGEVFAALTLYRTTGEPHWLSDAKRAVWRAIDALPSDDGQALQLFSGEPGVALAAVELENPSRSGMPIFEAIG